jgi:hypothetical protein
MNYLKLFEDFEDFEYPVWQMHVEDGIYHYYFRLQRMWFYLTFTTVKKLSGFWSAKYSEETDRTENIFLGKNALKIFPVLASIIEDFIKQEYPDVIVMRNVSLPNEVGVLQGLNKRARYNYEYLKKIQGYHLQYFNTYFKYNGTGPKIYGKTRTTTIGFLIKNGTSKSPEDYINLPILGNPYGEDVFFPVQP